MPTVGCEPTVSAGERAQTYALETGAAGTGLRTVNIFQKYVVIFYKTRPSSFSFQGT